MNVWIVILSGVLIASLPNLGNSALEDAGFFMSKNYTKFERRVWPAKTPMLCTDPSLKIQWFRFNIFEHLMQTFEKGNNSMNATFSLGTPVWMGAVKAETEFEYPMYCKYLPKAYQNVSGTIYTNFMSGNSFDFPLEYFAVKVNNTSRATIKKGWNYLINVVKNRFPNNPQTNYEQLVVEKTAAGVVYVGVIQR